MEEYSYNTVIPLIQKYDYAVQELILDYIVEETGMLNQGIAFIRATPKQMNNALQRAIKDRNINK